MKDHVIICGLGSIGFHVFELLHRAGIPVAVISDKTHEEWSWQVENAGGKFFAGDARDDNLLLSAGINEARAILALTSRDKVNLSIAIDAQKLNPRIKIISRIYDTELGNLVAEYFDIQQVFSTSEIAAPILSNSVTRKMILGQFDLDQKNFLVSEVNQKNAEFPPPIKTLATDGKVTLIANPIKKKPRRISAFMKLIESYYNYRTPAFLFFRRFLIILFSIIILSTLFLSWAMPLKFIDALYFVIATVSSVGYGDINFLNSTTPLKYFGCLLMLTGTAIIAILFSAVTEIILAKKLPNLSGGHPIPRKNHVIIVGSDHIGTRIVSALIEKGIPIVIIECGPEDRYPEDIARQVSIVSGNPKSENTLMRANIKTAKAILTVTKDDIENLSISLAAKKLNPNITEITQIDNTKLSGTLKKAVALTRVFSIPFIAAPYFVAAIFSPRIIFAIEWHHQIIYLWDDRGEIKINTINLQ